MVTVHRQRGLRIVIFVDDHQPAHVHVFSDGEAKVSLIDGEGAPVLISAAGMSRAELRHALRMVKEQQAYLLERWSEIHG